MPGDSESPSQMFFWTTVGDVSYTVMPEDTTAPCKYSCDPVILQVTTTPNNYRGLIRRMICFVKADYKIVSCQKRIGAYLGILLGLLCQRVKIDLLLLLDPLVVRLVQGDLQSECILAIHLPPVDRAICAVDGLVTQLNNGNNNPC
jgi:hypothetical protein